MTRLLRTTGVVLAQAVATVAVVVGAGAVGGVLWNHWWTPPIGQVQAGVWGVYTETGLRAQFAAVGLYVVIAIVAGLLTGAVTGLVFDRSELVALVVVLGAAVLAGWVMWRVGLARSPADPQSLAPTAADGAELPGRLALGSRTPFVSFPVGSLVGYAFVLIAVTKPGRRRDGTHRSRRRWWEDDPDDPTSWAARPGRRARASYVEFPTRPGG